MSFGILGGKFFALLNVIQLVGWTGIMIYDSSLSLNGIFSTQKWIWSAITGLLIILWILAGIKNIGKLSLAAMIALFALTIVMCKVIFFSESSNFSAESMEALSFGQAIELAVAMPLSWLPVVGDYTREARREKTGAAASTIAYFIGSCWMFAIGLGCALFAGSDDIAAVLSQAGFGIAAAVLGTALAIFAPVNDFEGFLYLIGSIFAPMASLVIADYFLLNRNVEKHQVDWRNVVLWACGFVLYRFSLGWDLPCGNTLPVMVVIIVAAIVVEAIARARTSSMVRES